MVVGFQPSPHYSHPALKGKPQGNHQGHYPGHKPGQKPQPPTNHAVHAKPHGKMMVKSQPAKSVQQTSGHGQHSYAKFKVAMTKPHIGAFNGHVYSGMF